MTATNVKVVSMTLECDMSIRPEARSGGDVAMSAIANNPARTPKRARVKRNTRTTLTSAKAALSPYCAEEAGVTALTAAWRYMGKRVCVMSSRQWNGL